MKLKITLLALLATSPAYAAVVANYDFTSITDPNEAADTFLSSSIDTDADSLASAITSPSTDFTNNTHVTTRVNPEFGEINNSSASQAVGWTARSNNPVQDFGVYLPVDTYFSFDVAAQGGKLLDFASVSLVTGVFKTISGTTANDYTLSYSLDGTSFTGAGTIASGTNPGDAVQTTVNGAFSAPISFDVSGITALQGVAGTAYFRIDPVATSGSSQNGSGTQRGGFIDDVVVNATTVPEPSSTALLGLGGLALMLRRRK